MLGSSCVLDSSNLSTDLSSTLTSEATLLKVNGGICERSVCRYPVFGTPCRSLGSFLLEPNAFRTRCFHPSRSQRGLHRGWKIPRVYDPEKGKKRSSSTVQAMPEQDVELTSIEGEKAWKSRGGRGQRDATRCWWCRVTQGLRAGLERARTRHSHRGSAGGRLFWHLTVVRSFHN
jgi:hypothetical protein